jgi:hypothetical protein
MRGTAVSATPPAIAHNSGGRSSSSSKGLSSPRSATTTMAKIDTMVVDTASTM